jgi:hypothetical protein
MPVGCTREHTIVRQTASFFYGEPHNAFLDLTFPVTVDRTCIIYGDNAVYLGFIATNGGLGRT